jgi:hypothetical protein
MTTFELQVDRAKARYDQEQGITYITYEGELDGTVTVQVYDWLDELYKAVGVEKIYGQIFDFRNVTRFDQSNLTTARRTSNRMNMIQDTSQFPVALIVNDHAQEEILRGPMRIPSGHVRKRIVWSEDEARAFLDEWNRENKS